MTAPTSPVFLTVPEVAEALRVSKMTVYRLIEREELPAARVGRSLRVPERGFHRYVQEQLEDGVA